MASVGGVEQLGEVKFKGHLGDGKNLSAIGLVGDLLLVAGDADDRLKVIRRRGGHYDLLPGREVVLNEDGAEADIEGIACEGDTVYAVGSHSCRRPKPKGSASRAENRARLELPEAAPASRCVLARFRLSADGAH